MSEEQKPLVVPVEPVKESVEPEGEELTKEEKSNAPEISCGYLVGLQPSGDFVFEILGADTGLVQLLGLHQYAEHQLSVLTDLNQKSGWPRINRNIESLTSMVKAILNTLTKQAEE